MAGKFSKFLTFTFFASAVAGACYYLKRNPDILDRLTSAAGTGDEFEDEEIPACDASGREFVTLPRREKTEEFFNDEDIEAEVADAPCESCCGAADFTEAEDFSEVQETVPESSEASPEIDTTLL